MRSYFVNMPQFGRELNKGQILSSEENVKNVKAVEAEFKEAFETVKSVGLPEEKINARGQMTVWQRLRYLVDPGTWCSLHTLSGSDRCNHPVIEPRKLARVLDLAQVSPAPR